MIYKINGKIALVGEVEREENEDTIGATVSFNSLKEYKNGDKLKVYDGKKLKWEGMIISCSINTVPPHSYTAMDYGFNLKSEEHAQIKGRADVAIKNLCKKFGIPVECCQIPTVINKMYPDQPISDIFSDILKLSGKEQGKSYRMSVDKGKLLFKEKGKEKVTSKFLVSDEVSLTRSIEEMFNSVKIISEDTEDKRIYATAKDKTSIKRYGLLQTVETVSSKKISGAKAISENRLKSLCKEKVELPITILAVDGAWDIKVSMLIKLNLKQNKGWHRIRNLTHHAEDDTIDITLEWLE